jgi:hypothetical protein
MVEVTQGNKKKTVEKRQYTMIINYLVIKPATRWLVERNWVNYSGELLQWPSRQPALEFAMSVTDQRSGLRSDPDHKTRVSLTA